MKGLSQTSMTDKKFNLEAYLKRINYSGSTDPTEETLNDIHICHTLNVPFENLDVFYGKSPLLDEVSLYNKIVENSRGGYCFEMNGIFSIALKSMGFKVADLLARVTIDGTNYTSKTHQVILVETEKNKWLTDVGFGNDGIIAPLLLVEGMDQKQFAHIYRIIKEPRFGGYLLQKKAGDTYNSMYAFTMDECYPEDFIMSNHYTATFPESFFKIMRMCTMPTKEGRITLTDDQFKVIKNGNTAETEINNEDEFNRYLKQYFKLDLDSIKP
jgi:N-hydroxyarylamine O-acetyltransferase